MNDIPDLEDKLYELALSGKQSTDIFKNLSKCVEVMKMSLYDEDAERMRLVREQKIDNLLNGN